MILRNSSMFSWNELICMHNVYQFIQPGQMKLFFHYMVTSSTRLYLFFQVLLWNTHLDISQSRFSDTLWFFSDTFGFQWYVRVNDINLLYLLPQAQALDRVCACGSDYDRDSNCVCGSNSICESSCKSNCGATATLTATVTANTTEKATATATVSAAASHLRAYSGQCNIYIYIYSVQHLIYMFHFFYTTEQSKLEQSLIIQRFYLPHYTSYFTIRPCLPTHDKLTQNKWHCKFPIQSLLSLFEYIKLSIISPLGFLIFNNWQNLMTDIIYQVMTDIISQSTISTI